MYTPPPTFIDMQCQYCGIIFQTQYLTQRYCCYRHKERAADKRRRTKDLLNPTRVVGIAESVEDHHREILRQAFNPTPEQVERAAIFKPHAAGLIDDAELERRLAAFDAEHAPILSSDEAAEAIREYVRASPGTKPVDQAPSDTTPRRTYNIPDFDPNADTKAPLNSWEIEADKKKEDE